MFYLLTEQMIRESTHFVASLNMFILIRWNNTRVPELQQTNKLYFSAALIPQQESIRIQGVCFMESVIHISSKTTVSPPQVRTTTRQNRTIKMAGSKSGAQNANVSKTHTLPPNSRRQKREIATQCSRTTALTQKRRKNLTHHRAPYFHQ
jgi:hypothetical protein